MPVVYPNTAKKTDWWYPLVKGFQSEKKGASRQTEIEKYFLICIGDQFDDGVIESIAQQYARAYAMGNKTWWQQFQVVRKAMYGMKQGLDREPLVKLVQEGLGTINTLSVGRIVRVLENKCWNNYENAGYQLHKKRLNGSEESES